MENNQIQSKPQATNVDHSWTILAAFMMFILCVAVFFIIEGLRPTNAEMRYQLEKAYEDIHALQDTIASWEDDHEKLEAAGVTNDSLTTLLEEAREDLKAETKDRKAAEEKLRKIAEIVGADKLPYWFGTTAPVQEKGLNVKYHNLEVEGVNGLYYKSAREEFFFSKDEAAVREFVQGKE